MQTLTGFQRKHLRGLAHSADPLVHVGKFGLTEPFLASFKEHLAIHELIKVKFLDFKKDRKELTKKMEEAADCACVGLIGHVAIFYRPQDDAKKRKIKLPTKAAKVEVEDESQDD